MNQSILKNLYLDIQISDNNEPNENIFPKENSIFIKENSSLELDLIDSIRKQILLGTSKININSSN